MAEEIKNTAVEEEAKEEQAAPKVVYGYTVKRYDNGLYDFDGITLEGSDTPSIDLRNIALDLVELGRKLDHQLMVEEAERRAVNTIVQLLQQKVQESEAEADPTKAE